MNYRVKHVDTDKAIEHIEQLIRDSYRDQSFKKAKVDEYYEGEEKKEKTFKEYMADLKALFNKKGDTSDDKTDENK